MIDEVKKCVNTKTDFFETYFTIPDNLLDEVNDFINETKKLGESCQNGEEFEAKFVSTGLSDRFNALIPKCKPKSRKMTQKEKQQSKEIFKGIIMAHKEELAKDALSDVVSGTINKARDEQIAKNRERMIEDGTYADYTILETRIIFPILLTPKLRKKNCIFYKNNIRL